MTVKARAIPGWPRAMCEEWAAAYLGQISVSAFRTLVDAGKLPAAVRVTSVRKAWLIEDLDAYLDAKSGKKSDATHPPSEDEMAAVWNRALDDFRAA